MVNLRFSPSSSPFLSRNSWHTHTWNTPSRNSALYQCVNWSPLEKSVETSSRTALENTLWLIFRRANDGHPQFFHRICHWDAKGKFWASPIWTPKFMTLKSLNPQTWLVCFFLQHLRCYGATSKMTSVSFAVAQNQLFWDNISMDSIIRVDLFFYVYFQRPSSWLHCKQWLVRGASLQKMPLSVRVNYCIA